MVGPSKSFDFERAHKVESRVLENLVEFNSFRREDAHFLDLRCFERFLAPGAGADDLPDELAPFDDPESSTEYCLNLVVSGVHLVAVGFGNEGCDVLVVTR